jgi:hypothetical protein
VAEKAIIARGARKEGGMSSLYAATKEAELFFAMQNYESAADACAFAEDIMRQHWPKPGENPVAICCFTIEGSVLWCHDNILETDFKNKTVATRERIPLYRAEIEQRPKLCQACREDCRERIEILAQALAGKTGAL